MAIYRMVDSTWNAGMFPRNSFPKTPMRMKFTPLNASVARRSTHDTPPPPRRKMNSEPAISVKQKVEETVINCCLGCRDRIGWVGYYCDGEWSVVPFPYH